MLTGANLNFDHDLYNPPGARFQVDGTTYYSAVTFVWPDGSNTMWCLLPILPPPLRLAHGSNIDRRITPNTPFQGWEDNNKLVQPANVPIQVITANPAITSFTAQVTVSYRLRLSYFTSPNPANPFSARLRGARSYPRRANPARRRIRRRAMLLVVGRAIYASEYAEPLNAYPYPGFAFRRWTINGSNPTPFLTPNGQHSHDDRAQSLCRPSACLS